MMAMEEDSEECSAVSRVQSGSGRLGAAVQRVMAIRERERQSSVDGSDNVSGIGEMRRICLANNSSDPFCFSDRFEHRSFGVEYRSWADEELGNDQDLLAKRTQSMRYAPISSVSSDHGEWQEMVSKGGGVKGSQSKKSGLVSLICKQLAFIKRHTIWSSHSD